MATVSSDVGQLVCCELAQLRAKWPHLWQVLGWFVVVEGGGLGRGTCFSSQSSLSIIALTSPSSHPVYFGLLDPPVMSTKATVWECGNRQDSISRVVLTINEFIWPFLFYIKRYLQIVQLTQILIEGKSFSCFLIQVRKAPSTRTCSSSAYSAHPSPVLRFQVLNSLR